MGRGRPGPAPDMHRFDPDKLFQALATLPAQARAAFALACAERLAHGADQDLSRETAEMTRATRDLATQYVRVAAMEPEALATLATRLDASADLDNDSAAACAHLLAFLRCGDAQTVVWAAQRAVDAADSFAQWPIRQATWICSGPIRTPVQRS